MPNLYESQPIVIGKHQWRVTVSPSYHGGNSLDYQWRRTPLPGMIDSEPQAWRCSEDWPSWNGNDTYCGLPKRLKMLYYREVRELDRYLGREAKIPPQLELFSA